MSELTSRGCENTEIILDDDGIASLVAALASNDGLGRQDARERLVAVGKPAVVSLLAALTAPDEHTRWEAAKALGEIRDPRSAPALVQALMDGMPAVRWLAASGLIALGRSALIPVLEELERNFDSIWMREGAHHILYALVEKGVASEALPVLEALEDIEPAVEVPVAAYKALMTLRRQSP